LRWVSSQWQASSITVAVVLAEYCGYIGSTRIFALPAALSRSRTSDTDGAP